MSATAASLQQKDYDERKLFLEELKTLVKSEQEEMFRIIKADKIEYSENSNGIFFDVSSIPDSIFEKMKQFMEFCRKNRADFADREEKEKVAQDALHRDTF
jgi:hypothetical protein